MIAAASTPEKLAAASARVPRPRSSTSTRTSRRGRGELTDGGVDVVIDPVGGPHSEPALGATRSMGRYLVIGFAAGAIRPCR